MKMAKHEVKRFYTNLKRIIDSDEELKIEVIYALTKTKNKMKSIIDEIDEMMNSFLRTERLLNVKWCNKDKDGKPIIRNSIDKNGNTVGNYVGLEFGVHPEYDKESEAIYEKQKEFLREEVEIPIHDIEKEYIPKSGKASTLEVLCYFMKEEDSDGDEG